MILSCVMPARRKNQQNKSKKREQASRGFKKPSPLLAEILELVNMVPPEAELPDPSETWDKVYKNILEGFEKNDSVKTNREESEPMEDFIIRLLEETDSQLEATELLQEQIEAITIRTIEECLKDLPQTFSNYVLQVGEEDLYPKPERHEHEAYYRYSFVRESRNNLRAIIAQNNASPAATAAGFQKLPIITQVTIRIDDDGKIEISPHMLARAIEGIEANRLRECEICRRIFFAGRITQQGCSPACAMP